MFGVAKTRCKYPVSSETVRLVGTAMKDKWGDSREGTSLSVTSEVHKGNQVPLRNSGVPECAGRQGNVRHKPCKDYLYDTDRCLRGCAVSSEF